MHNLKPGDKHADARIQHFSIISNGVQNRMGHSARGQHPPLVSPDQLKPGDWTYEDTKTAYYIAIDPAKKLADCHIEIPTRPIGVNVSVSCAHLVLRNIKITLFIEELHQAFVDRATHDDGVNRHRFPSLG